MTPGTARRAERLLWLVEEYGRTCHAIGWHLGPFVPPCQSDTRWKVGEVGTYYLPYTDATYTVLLETQQMIRTLERRMHALLSTAEGVAELERAGMRALTAGAEKEDDDAGR